MDFGLAGRACIVTGASRGIGRATAHALAAEGAAVLLVGRREQPLQDTAAQCREAGGRAETLALDITDPKAPCHVCDTCQDRLGGLDVLVNNAGTSTVTPLDKLTDEDWQAQWDLHVMAPMRLMREAAPAMADQNWGRIVNVCSSSGKRPSSTNAAYSVTKAAELSLSRAFADAYAGQGVLVNAVAPGPVGGDLWLSPGGLADQQAESKGISRDEVLEATAAKTPRGQLASEAEIAAVIVFLCSQAAANVVGAAWSVDGGSVPVII